MKQEDEDFRMARFGIEADAFLESEIGKFLLEMAEGKKESALREFMTADTTDQATVIRLQNEMRIPEMITGWLYEAISAGRLAEQQIREEFIE